MEAEFHLAIVVPIMGYILNYYPTHPVYDYYRILYL